jgi:hypothetical protein
MARNLPSEVVAEKPSISWAADKPKIGYSSIYSPIPLLILLADRRVDLSQHQLNSHATYSEKPHMEVVLRSSF